MMFLCPCWFDVEAFETMSAEVSRGAPGAA